MLGLLAAKLRMIGQIVATLAKTESIRPLVAKYLEDIESVSQAHLAFWNLQGENATVTASNDASARIKTTIQTGKFPVSVCCRPSSAQPPAGHGCLGAHLSGAVGVSARHGRSQENREHAKAGELLIKTSAAWRNAPASPGRNWTRNFPKTAPKRRENDQDRKLFLSQQV
jgi:hypothetical protein